MISGFIDNLEPKALVSFIKTLSATTDYELPIFALIMMAIIPGFIDELIAALAIGGAAVLIRVIRNEIGSKEQNIELKLSNALRLQQITDDDYKSSIEFLQRTKNSK